MVERIEYSSSKVATTLQFVESAPEEQNRGQEYDETLLHLLRFQLRVELLLQQVQFALLGSMAASSSRRTML